MQLCIIEKFTLQLNLQALENISKMKKMESKYQLFPSQPNPADGFHLTNSLSATPSTSSAPPINQDVIAEEKLNEAEMKRKNRAEKKRKNEEEKGKLHAFVFIIKNTHVLF